MKRIIILILLLIIINPLPAASRQTAKRQINTVKKTVSNKQAISNYKEKKNLSNDTEIIILDVENEPVLTPSNTPNIAEIKQLCPNAFIKNYNFADIASISSDNKEDGRFKLSITTQNKLPDRNTLWSKSWDFLKGKKNDDNINFLMYSYHTRGDRELLNNSNKLLSLDYSGYTVGTYYNSFHTQTYYVGLTRKLFEQKLAEGVSMNLKYKVLILRGYKYEEPDIAGFTPTIIPVLGFSKGLLGVDFLISPGKAPTFATTFRVNLDPIKPKNNRAKI